MKPILLPCACILLLAPLAGCPTTTHHPQHPPFAMRGIPNEEYLVERDYIVHFTAPGFGVVYWVEETRLTIVDTKVVQPLEKVKYSIEALTDEMARSQDIDKRNGIFALYFVPNAVINQQRHSMRKQR
jgi:hypothetical protein